VSQLEYESLHHNLKLLDLITFESILDNYLEIAAKDEKSTIEILDYLIAQEVQSKETRSLDLSMRLAGFPIEKRLDDFDFKFQPSIDKASNKEMASLKFIITLRMFYSWGRRVWEKPILLSLWESKLPKQDSE